jgi:hypothetical protein
VTLQGAPAPIERRSRPVLVELASALLIVGAIINLLFSIDVLNELLRGGSDVALYAVVTIALATISLGLGIAIRYGRLWMTTINVAAVLGFLEILSATPVGVFFGVIDVAIVLALVRERPWFEWMTRQRQAAEAERAKPGTRPG